MPEMNNVTTPKKEIKTTTPNAPKKLKHTFEVNYIVPRKGPLF